MLKDDTDQAMRIVKMCSQIGYLKKVWKDVTTDAYANKYCLCVFRTYML